MPVKSSRFARRAYARRAASLAEELADWWFVYKTRAAHTHALVYDARQADALEDRAEAIYELAQRLREIALRIEALH